MILELDEIEPSGSLIGEGNQRSIFLSRDANGREIWFTRLREVQFCGDSVLYPDISLYSAVDGQIYAPIREQIMSLARGTVGSTQEIPGQTHRHYVGPVFFFIYNTDNYYHFVYDTIPYLISFMQLRREWPEMRLLMSRPNSQKTDLYKFVLEFLALFGVSESEIVLADAQTCYSEVFLSSSYTHDHKSNIAPRNEIFSLYQELAKAAVTKAPSMGPRRIYISRRTWLHGDFSNIGTNYTDRRRLENEDALVELLNQRGFVEIFTENLSTVEKIALFSNVEIVVGALGGGVCNVLFSPPQTKLLCLVSPTFLDVNARFAYSLSRVQLTWFRDTEHVESGRFKRFMRVACPSRSIVGEIVDVQEEQLTVAYTSENVAGWNAQNKYSHVTVPLSECVPLDSGLNSAWRINLEAFRRTLDSVL